MLPFTPYPGKTFDAGITSGNSAQQRVNGSTFVNTACILTEKLESRLQADAQKAEKLDFNESIHSHPSGGFVLQALQNSMTPQYVVSELMTRYLVEASWERVVAYRHYREQLGTYWTM